MDTHLKQALASFRRVDIDLGRVSETLVPFVPSTTTADFFSLWEYSLTAIFRSFQAKLRPITAAETSTTTSKNQVILVNYTLWSNTVLFLRKTPFVDWKMHFYKRFLCTCEIRFKNATYDDVLRGFRERSTHRIGPHSFLRTCGSTVIYVYWTSIRCRRPMGSQKRMRPGGIPAHHVTTTSLTPIANKLKL